ncbi:MAG: HD domain-containing protein [Vicinamibacterales bacterium]
MRFASRDLLDRVRACSPGRRPELLRRAYVFSALEHKGQVRHSGEPYLVHPLEVADILAGMKLDAVCVAAGLLHDVVEDTLTTPDTLRERFGEDVTHIVEGVASSARFPLSSSEERQVENFRKMLLAMVDDIRVILVKLADRLHNMRTLQHVPEDRRVRIAQETQDIYAPIANRLGMAKIKNELEELSFKYLEPVTPRVSSRGSTQLRNAEGSIEELKSRITAKLADARSGSSRSTAASSASTASG